MECNHMPPKVGGKNTKSMNNGEVTMHIYKEDHKTGSSHGTNGPKGRLFRNFLKRQYLRYQVLYEAFDLINHTSILTKNTSMIIHNIFSHSWTNMKVF